MLPNLHSRSPNTAATGVYDVLYIGLVCLLYAAFLVIPAVSEFQTPESSVIFILAHDTLVTNRCAIAMLFVSPSVCDGRALLLYGAC